MKQGEICREERWKKEAKKGGRREKVRKDEKKWKSVEGEKKWW